MQWWNDFVDWLLSSDAQGVIFSAAVLAVAIIVSGLLASWISRGAVRGLLARAERDQKTAAIAALVDAATEASVWNSLTPQEQVLSDRAVGQADILVRLLPIKGAGVAANWASHQLSELKRNSATYGYQLDPLIAEFRDRLVEWQQKPGRARRAFQNDLERWRFELNDEQRTAVSRQEEWVAQQHHERFAPASAPVTPAVQHAAPVAAAPRQTQQLPATAPAAEGSAVPAETQQLIDDVAGLGMRRGAESAAPSE